MIDDMDDSMRGSCETYISVVIPVYNEEENLP